MRVRNKNWIYSKSYDDVNIVNIDDDDDAAAATDDVATDDDDGLTSTNDGLTWTKYYV